MNPRISEKINYLSEFICNEINEGSLVNEFFREDGTLEQVDIYENGVYKNSKQMN